MIVFLMSILRRLKDLSISRKLYIIVGAMAILIVAELVTLWLAITTLSAVRATVGAEGFYSKAQKDAIYQLAKYGRTQNERDYREFLRYMQVPLGDRKTRLELIKEDPDLQKAEEGFREGKVHPNDIPGVITMLQRFSSEKHISKAIETWSKGDSMISLLMPLGDSIHAEIRSENPSTVKIEGFFIKIESLNQRLTLLEDDFSNTLGEGSRWLENFILKLLFSVALTVEITGLILTILVSRSIRKGLNEITQTTKKISKGDLSARATVFSGDEIGQVATAVNEMTNRLTSSNKELSQFAYIASHDLQEPLRTISNYVSLFQKQYKGVLDSNADKYLESMSNATERMQLLIRDLLEYSQIGQNRTISMINCNDIVQGVLEDMSLTIRENKVSVRYDKLPSIGAYPELRMLFQNLISNAIKFRKKEGPCTINIKTEQKPPGWLFSIQDNGIGIDPKYQEKIFVIFQRLHSKKEYPGSGIGLAQCKKIVEMHGGIIWFTSTPGEGTTFYFTIPKLSTK
ncbi:MAG: ATP-binding protein [Chitinophagaceae bacterium]